MQEVGAFEANDRLSALLDRVEQGEEIVITRRGRPVAKLVAAGPGFDRAKARRAVAGLIKASRGLSLGGSRSRKLPLATLDHDLRKAAAALGLAVLGQ